MWNGDLVSFGANGVVRLTSPGGNALRCTGILFRDRWVLTANHCVAAADVQNPGNVVVQVVPGVTRQGDLIVRHPKGFDEFGKNKIEVALIRLDQPYTGQSSFPKLSSASLQDVTGQQIDCYGYGADGITPSTDLRHAALSVHSADPGNVNRFRVIPNGKGQVPAPGDSGGPCFLNNTNEIVGVFSAGPGLGQNGEAPSYGAYTLASTFRKWAQFSVNWNKFPGKAREIAVGADGSVWILGQTQAGPGGYRLYRWNTSSRDWESQSGKGWRIAVDPNGLPWIITLAKEIRRRTSSGWQSIPGKATDIAVGAEGSVWILGDSPVKGGGYRVYRWDTDSEKWQEVTGVEDGAKKIAVDPKGNPWVVNAAGKLFFYVSGSWQGNLPDKVTDVALGPDNSSWALGTSILSGGGYGIFRWKGGWSRIKGLGGQRIAVDPEGRAWVIGEGGDIYKFHGF